MMMIDRRRMMGKTGGSLPYDAELTYLQSDGNGARIVTDIKLDSNSSFDITFNFGNITIRTFPCGVYSQSGDGYLAVNTSGNLEGFNPSLNVRNAQHTITISYNEVKVDGTAYTNKRNGFLTNSTRNFFTIFQHQYNGTSDGSIVQFVSATFRQNGAVAHELIPVRIGQEGYIYDKTTSTFFSNDGSGTMTLGSDKV